jgi:hypothetical protein
MIIPPFCPETFQSDTGSWYWYEPNRGHPQTSDPVVVLYYVYGPFPIKALADKDSEFFFSTRSSSASHRYAWTLAGIRGRHHQCL